MIPKNKTSIEVLVKEIKNLPKIESIAIYKSLLAQLEDVAFDGKDLQWMHFYYKAICWIRMGFIEESGSRKDVYFNKAEKLIEEGLKLSPKESELYVLRALMNQGKILVSVVARGMRYISDIESDLRKAKSLNPLNPRAYFLLGQSYLNKPSFIGGSKQIALFNFKKAKEKFLAQEDNFHAFYPTWGNWQNEEELNKLL